MKKLIFLFVVYTLLVLGIPLIITLSFRRSAPPEKTAAPKEPVSAISTYLADADKVVELDFSDYLKGVVAAEMPASFHPEALKAQAVAARSYILRRMQAYEKDGAPPEHKGAYACTDPTHCKAYSSTEKLRAQWGDAYDDNMQKIADSVEQTAGIVMTYEGELVNAVFHSTSAGKTENAKDVWGGDVDYLVSVPSYGDELSPRYSSSVTLSADDYIAKLKTVYPEAEFPEGTPLIGEIVRSEAGGIKTVSTGGVTLTGMQFRNLFGLRSTHIEFMLGETAVTMDVKGYGHGVGMSQYGANYLAEQGKTYTEILQTYYTGVTVEACRL